jgi:hypothetical protein
MKEIGPPTFINSLSARTQKKLRAVMWELRQKAESHFEKAARLKAPFGRENHPAKPSKFLLATEPNTLKSGTRRRKATPRFSDVSTRNSRC